MAGRRDKRLTVGDWFLILLLVLTVVSLLLRFRALKGNDVETLDSYAVYARWENVDNRSIACLQSGEAVYTAAGEMFGTLLSFEIIPVESEVISGGAVYRLPSEERCHVILRLAVPASIQGSRLMIRGREAISVGTEIKVYTQWAELPLRTVRFEKNPLFSSLSA